MMKNKWIFIVGSSMLVIGLVACSDTTNKTESSDENAVQQETASNEKNNQTTNNEERDKQEENDESENNKESNKNENNDGDEQPEFATEINIVEDKSVTALVNKFNSLGEHYEPDDLVTVDVPTVLENLEVKQMRQVAANALEEMFTEAKDSNVILHARSGYRSYQTQVQLFNNYAEEHGEEAANRYSAKPGFSEHQTGLVMDVTSEGVNFELDESFGETKEGKWLRDHAHEFGFIIRYPKDMEDITGYVYEPWHLRYLGVDVATAIYESELTYEEFLVEEGIIHEVNAEKNDEEA